MNIIQKAIFYLITIPSRIDKANIILKTKSKIIDLEYQHRLVNSFETEKELSHTKRFLEVAKKCPAVILMDELNSLHKSKDHLTDEICIKWIEGLEAYVL
jgi:hypothetical protein